MNDLIANIKAGAKYDWAQDGSDEAGMGLLSP